MIRHPSENFIKYLMTSSNPQAQQDSWVVTMLVSLGYPRPDQDYITWVRAEVDERKPLNFQAINRYHRDSVKFMRSEGIYALHNPDKSAKEAHLIVTNLRARPIIESLLLGRMEPKEIAKKINTRLGEFFTAEGIESYKHYYWNTDLLSVEDWSQLLADYDVQRQNTLAILQVGPSMALHKMGFQQLLDSKTILRDMLEGLYFDFREWKTKDHGINRTRSMTAIAKAATMLDTQLSQSDSALKDSLRAFEQFRMQHAKVTVPGLRDVAPEGNYTQSGARLLEASTSEDTENE
jgi:hypothetical protein